MESFVALKSMGEMLNFIEVQIIQNYNLIKLSDFFCEK